jgi:peptidoglycan/xylan/chitin deacetylase (PgdA/CDA1 family)
MLARPGTKNIPILMYHSISQSAAHFRPKLRGLCVPPESFAAQVDYLYHNKYTLLNVTQLIHALTGKTALPERPVVLTFDDGYADFYYHALPVLSRYDLTATLYIVTGLLGTTSPWNGAPMLTWNQIAEISNSGIECGAHTHSHPKLDTLPLTMVRNEIGRSRDLLEQHLGQQVTSFAYPYGFYTADVRQVVKEAGFTSACATKFAMCSDTADHFTLERLMVIPRMDMDTFHALITQKGYSQLRKSYVRASIPIKHALRCGIASTVRFYKTIQDPCHKESAHYIP